MSQQTMQSSTSSAKKVSHSLKVRGKIQEKRDVEMAKISAEAIRWDLDAGNDSLASLLDCVYTNGGSKTLLQMTNFTYHDIGHLWHHCHTILSKKQKVYS